MIFLFLINSGWLIINNAQYSTTGSYNPLLLQAIYHGHKNTPPFRNLITSATDYLSSLIIFSNFDDTTVGCIIVNSEATNLNTVIGNYISGTDIASETTLSPVTHPE